MRVARTSLAVVGTLVLIAAATSDASAQRRLDRFREASAPEAQAAPHADWTGRTATMVVSGAALGGLAGTLYTVIACAGEEVVEGVFGAEERPCSSEYFPAILIGALIGGGAGYLLDLIIGHPHESQSAP